MRYQPPFNSSNADAPYVNGNPVAGIQGSIPPAAAIEHPQRELVAIIEAVGKAPSDENVRQVLNALRSNRIWNPLVETGATVNELLLTLPALDNVADLSLLHFTVPTGNTAAVTLTVNGVTKPIMTPAQEPLPAGVLIGGSVAMVAQVESAWVLLAPLAGSGSSEVVASGLAPLVFITPGMYDIVAPPIDTWTQRIVTGGGGGGAGSASNYGGGCGGAGGTSISFGSLTPNARYAALVGAPGAGGTIGNIAGQPGGMSSAFGMSATGGEGGGNDGVNGYGGQGGVGTGGQLNLRGGAGGNGMNYPSMFGTMGGASYWGGGTRAGTSTPAEWPTAAWGSGGGAHYKTAGPGAAGQVGAIIVYFLR